MTDKTEKMTWRILDLVMGITVAATAGTLTWAVKSQHQLALDVAGIKASRFTSEDGLVVWREIASIRENLAAMPTEVPPPWFSAKVESIERRQEQILLRLTEIERQIP